MAPTAAAEEEGVGEGAKITVRRKEEDDPILAVVIPDSIVMIRNPNASVVIKEIQSSSTAVRARMMNRNVFVRVITRVSLDPRLFLGGCGLHSWVRTIILTRFRIRQEQAKVCLQGKPLPYPYQSPLP